MPAIAVAMIAITSTSRKLKWMPSRSAMKPPTRKWMPFSSFA